MLSYIFSQLHLNETSNITYAHEAGMTPSKIEFLEIAPAPDTEAPLNQFGLSDSIDLIFEPTIKKLEREKKALLQNNKVSEENKSLLATYDTPTSIEALMKLDELIDNINMDLADERVPGPQKVIPIAITMLLEQLGVHELNMNRNTILLDALGLTRLPERLIERLQQYPNLKQLWLSDNQLTTLPESIGKLTALTWINFSNNQVSTIPESFSNFQNLSALYADRNKLSMFPELICKLAALTTLSLNENQLIALPESISRLKKLKNLRLRDNQLTTLPESLSNLENLSDLDLNFNKLRSLPKSFGDLAALSILYLVDNQLTDLPESFVNLSALNVLALSHNRLITLPKSFGNLAATLVALDLGHNQLTSLPESFGNLAELTVLLLDNNPFAVLPESARKLLQRTSNTKYLDLIALLPKAKVLTPSFTLHTAVRSTAVKISEVNKSNSSYKKSAPKISRSKI